MTDQHTWWNRWAEKWTPESQIRLQKMWEWFSFGVLGLNSFILLYFHGAQGGIQYVVCAGAIGYAAVLSLQTVLYRHCPERRMRILKRSKKAFRLIYTAIYLTTIMLDVISESQTANSMQLLAYYGLTFIWVAIWGTNCLWGNKLLPVMKRFAVWK